MPRFRNKQKTPTIYRIRTIRAVNITSLLRRIIIHFNKIFLEGNKNKEILRRITEFLIFLRLFKDL